MNILIISQYFWPENFRINQLTKSLIKKGHNIEILTSLPNYPTGKVFSNYIKNPNFYKKFFNAKIHRIESIPRKEGKNYQIFINYISFLYKSYLYIIKNFKKNKFDIVFTFAPSPITISLLSFLPCFKNSKKVIWLLDLWPEILYDLKLINNFLLQFIFKKFINYIYLKNDFLFVQSEGFKKALLPVVNDKKKIGILYAWNENEIKKKIKNFQKFRILKKNFKKDFLNIIFTGNVGLAQNFDYLSKIIFDLSLKKNIKISWHFFGSGRDIERQKKFIYSNKIKNVYYYDYIENIFLEKFVKLSDALLIILRPGQALNATIPGKFANYLHYNKTILGSISGPTSNYIKKYKLGFVSEPDDIIGFKKNIEYMYFNKKKIKKLNNSRILKKFSQVKNLNYFINKIKKITSASLIKIKLLNNVTDIPLKTNFILAALNLAFLSYYASGKIFLSKKFILWPDGVFSNWIIKTKKIYKIPGREILKNMTIDSNIKYVHLVGNANSLGLNYIRKKFFNKKIIHTKLPYAPYDILCKLIPKLKKNEITLILLPTPKQEQIANYLASKNKNYRILCLGGALNMLSGSEPPVPPFLDKIYLEFFWRLRFDTRRRIMRLLESFFIFFRYWIKGFYKNFNLYNDK